MTVSVEEQLLIFLFSLFAGMGTGFLFDWFRVLRKAFSKKTTMVGDAAFFIIAAFFLFWALLSINDGVFRWYEWAGIAVGMAVYRMIFSRIVMRCSEFFLRTFQRILRFFVKILLFPVILLHRLLRKPIITVIHPARTFGKYLYRSFKRQKKERKRKREISKKIWKKI